MAKLMRCFGAYLKSDYEHATNTYNQGKYVNHRWAMTERLVFINPDRIVYVEPALKHDNDEVAALHVFVSGMGVIEGEYASVTVEATTFWQLFEMAQGEVIQ